MTQYPKIWFLRHGQTEWNKVYRLQGQLNSPLTEQGVAEAERQAQLMPAVLATHPALWVSPLGRARQTADIALAGAAYQTDARLMEIDAGRWQGLYRQDIVQAHPHWARQSPTALEIYEAAEGGEGLQSFRKRIVDFVDGLTGPTVIVAHGLLGQVLRAHVTGVPLVQAGALSNLQGIVYVLENGVERTIGSVE